MSLPSDDDAAWEPIRRLWSFRPGITYLNHGSFGPSPAPVRASQRQLQDQLEHEPMDFYLREFEPLLDAARGRLARFVGCGPRDLVFVENSTYGMNVVAASVRLQAGDEVLLTDHEYGAVERVWRRACAAVDAKVVIAAMPYPLLDDAEIVDTLRHAITPRTRLLVVSHVTSPTAAILPLAAICRMARELGVPVCVDGPHAVAVLDLDLVALDCDWYTASCHKWLCAPFGSGFLYVHPRAQTGVRAPVLSWGRVSPTKPQTWDDEFAWLGTRDPTPFLAVPAALDFFDELGWETFRARAHALVRYAKDRIVAATGVPPIVRDDRSGYVSMLALPLPAADAAAWQHALRMDYGIEIPVVAWRNRCFVRVSCHVYNTRNDVDRLMTALRNLGGAP